eukprot:CAMPEP_0185850986 /NCGR_PEP_ID=MMETSP1354-20130828/4902_1 /TAXON_ID=708628 /ORGANISM="Erythrolobus madagascarensis, Strain CCMP3276" /LENGTH=279 /DNA_ID=CAMNT_0028551723 /DNA_START=21 /DNA_END=860 /DNA_ORIENTATION=-
MDASRVDCGLRRVEHLNRCAQVVGGSNAALAAHYGSAMRTAMGRNTVPRISDASSPYPPDELLPVVDLSRSTRGFFCARCYAILLPCSLPNASSGTGAVLHTKTKLRPRKVQARRFRKLTASRANAESPGNNAGSRGSGDIAGRKTCLNQRCGFCGWKNSAGYLQQQNGLETAPMLPTPSEKALNSATGTKSKSEPLQTPDTPLCSSLKRTGSVGVSPESTSQSVPRTSKKSKRAKTRVSSIIRGGSGSSVPSRIQNSTPSSFTPLARSFLFSTPNKNP